MEKVSWTALNSRQTIRMLEPPHKDLSGLRILFQVLLNFDGFVAHHLETYSYSAAAAASFHYYYTGDAPT